MADVLKVSPQELKNASETFRNESAVIKSITESMLNIANELKSWTGEASNAYCSKLTGLGEGMNRMNERINQQAQNLVEMAGIFEQAENTNVQTANQLRKEDFV